MIEPKTIELMNRALDGALTEPERADLDRVLTASNEARTYYEAVARLVRRLDSVPLVDPPAEMHPRIVAALERVERTPAARRAAHGHHEGGFAAWFFGAFSAPRFRYASTFGLGLAAGAALWVVVQSGRSADGVRGVDPSLVSGTIATPSRATGLLPVAVPEAGVSGSIAVFDRGPGMEVRLKVDGDGGAEWVFDVPDRAEPTQSVVLRVVKSGETVFEGTVQPVEP